MNKVTIKQCQNQSCNNLPLKDKYGNYKTYCSQECKKIGTAAKYKNTYSIKDIDAITAKRKATTQLLYGVDNVAKTADVREKLSITTKDTAVTRLAKTKETNLKNHGVESTNSLQSVKDKKKAVFRERYGVDHQLHIPGVAASVAAKNSANARERLELAKITKEKIYGDENYNNRSKYKETCVERFGVENPSQNAEVHEKKVKNSFKSKDYRLPSGLVIKVQGYEPQALDELLQEYTEEEIKYSSIDKPRIAYKLEDGHYYYFPDFYIPKDNLIIEVKSQFTYDHNRTMALAKRDACLKQGYNYRFIIYP